MLSSYNLKNKQTIQISGLILQYCSATTLYRRLLRTVGTVVSDMGRLRMVKNINFLRHHKNIFDTLKNSDFSFFKRSTFLAVFWVSGGKIEVPIQVL